ncbi:MAG: ATP synthase subunit I [Pseudomonadota bacterium]
MAELESSNFDARLAQLIAQEILLLGVLAGLAWYLWTPPQAYAVLYGGAVVVINALLLGARVKGIQEDTARAQARLLGGAVQRFIFTLASMAAAFGWFKLPVGGVLVGLLTGHLVFLLHAAQFKRRFGEER